jgi:hypothetical protein
VLHSWLTVCVREKVALPKHTSVTITPELPSGTRGRGDGEGAIVECSDETCEDPWARVAFWMDRWTRLGTAAVVKRVAPRKAQEARNAADVIWVPRDAAQGIVYGTCTLGVHVASSN